MRNLDGFDPENPPKAITPIFDMILEHVTPTEDKSDQPLQLQIVNL